MSVKTQPTTGVSACADEATRPTCHMSQVRSNPLHLDPSWPSGCTLRLSRCGGDVMDECLRGALERACPARRSCPCHCVSGPRTAVNLRCASRSVGRWIDRQQVLESGRSSTRSIGTHESSAARWRRTTSLQRRRGQQRGGGQTNSHPATHGTSRCSDHPRRSCGGSRRISRCRPAAASQPVRMTSRM